MEFSVTALKLTMAVVVIEGLVAYYNGTLSSIQWKHINLSFMKHWGVLIGDLCIFPIINAFIIPCLHFNWWYVPGFILTLAITLQCHKSWWPDPWDENAQGFILDSFHDDWKVHSKFHWHRAVTPAGWIHVFFMTCQLAILGGYILTPMPRPVINAISSLLVVFLPLGVIEPGIVQSGGLKKITPRRLIRDTAIFIALLVAVLLVRFIKLN